MTNEKKEYFNWQLEYSKILQSVNDFLKEVLPFEEWDNIRGNEGFFKAMLKFVKDKNIKP